MLHCLSENPYVDQLSNAHCRLLRIRSKINKVNFKPEKEIEVCE